MTEWSTGSISIGKGGSASSHSMLCARTSLSKFGNWSSGKRIDEVRYLGVCSCNSPLTNTCVASAPCKGSSEDNGESGYWNSGVISRDHIGFTGLKSASGKGTVILKLGGDGIGGIVTLNTSTGE